MTDKNAEKAIKLQNLISVLRLIAKDYPGYTERLEALAYEASEEVVDLVATSFHL